jgi:uncharacterized protein YlxW (UPF0749 family)
MSFIKDITPMLAAIASMSALFIALVQRKNENRLKEAQVSINYEQLATAWINRLQERIKSLETEVIELKKIIQDYQDRLADVYSQFMGRGKRDIDV